MSKSLDRRLLRVAIEAELITEEQVDGILKTAARDKKPVSSLLIETAGIDETDFLGLVADRLRATPINLADCQIDSEVARVVPKELSYEHHLIPIAKIDHVMTLAVCNPFDVVTLDQLRNTTGCTVRLVFAFEGMIEEALNKVYKPGAAQLEAVMDELEVGDSVELKESDVDDSELDIEALGKGGDDSPVIKFVNLIVYQAVKQGASDIHIEPFDRIVRVRFRQDGVCAEVYQPPKSLLNSIVSRIKIICDMDIAERRRPQDGKFQMRVEGRQIDFRVSILPTVHGEKVVMRILDQGNLALSLESLGFEKKALKDFKEGIESSYGMILVTGPTGSGKSTTLYSAVKEILSDESNFVTVEDPVEYQVYGVNQVQVSEKRGLTFAGALRSILRQDPDVVMIGEIRDAETIEIAIKAALTGHLVLSTLHTNDAASTITRMVDMGVDPFMVASATLCVSAQRLARRLCRHCKEPMDRPPVGRLCSIGFTEEEAETVELFQPIGCGRCKNGYSGRFALLETMPINEDIQRMIVGGKSALDIKNSAIIDHGMITLRRCANLNAMRGHTSVEEVLRTTMRDEVMPDGTPLSEIIAKYKQVQPA